MEKLTIEKTNNTPYIDFDPEKGIFNIEGRSIPEDPGKFYNDLYKWLNDYFTDPKKKTYLHIKLEYLNSSSSKYITGLLHIMERNHTEGKDAEINWHYEEDDETIMEMGEHYKSSLEIPINLISFIEK